MKKIAFVGRSNVGKSSTIKALTGKKVKVGRRPGVTLRPNFIPFGNLEIVDMPGFGFMSGVSKERQEELKNFIVGYLEEHKNILFAVQIIDAKAFAEIARRWEKRGQIPVEVEMFDFLRELKLRPILIANKIDKVPQDQRDEKLDEICDMLGLLPPWRQWLDIVVPFSARTGEGLANLKRLIRKRIETSIRL